MGLAPGEFIVLGGSWSLIGTDWPAPSDVSVDLVFFPTYLVISILSLFWYRYPERTLGISGFQEALHESEAKKIQTLPTLGVLCPVIVSTHTNAAYSVIGTCFN